MSTVHCSNFMLDYIPLVNASQNMQDFVKEEPDYDLAFCRAWRSRSIKPEKDLSGNSAFLSLLVRINEQATSHLAPMKILNPYLVIYLKGPSVSENGYGFSKGVCADQKGVQDIIKKIWIAKENFQLRAYFREGKEGSILLKRDGIFSVDSATTPTPLPTLAGKESLNEIYDKFIPLFEKGLRADGGHRMEIIQTLPYEDRIELAYQYIIRYFKETKKSPLSTEEKIREIATLMRDLMQLHMYCEANGRSIYILTNALLSYWELPLFYPKNMCIFDGNSIDRIVEEITEGQVRFSAMFRSEEELSAQLANYENCIELLKIVIKIDYSQFPTLTKSFENRQLNLLFRQSAHDKRALPLLELLITNSEILGIDCSATGLTSGNALDVARKSGNLSAIPLLEALGLTETLPSGK